jgi:hypothetical protein
MRNTLIKTLSVCVTVGALAFVSGCQTTDKTPASASTPPTPQPAMTAPTPPAAAPAAAPAPAAKGGIVRVDAGAAAPFTDSSHNVWLADTGFDGGEVIERDASTAIANTKDAGLYLTEHYSMNSFSCTVPNGKYVAKLHFAETFEGITGPGERVFSFNVQGHDFKDFDVFKKAGGANRAYIETVPVEVTNGTFKITFTSNVENPEINAIELAPQ